MPLIEVKVLEGVFTAQQKQEIIERLTDAMVAIEGESMRPSTWCVCGSRSGSFLFAEPPPASTAATRALPGEKAT